MHPYISIIGPTATGKTAFALQLIKVLQKNFTQIQVISVDSRQVYKGMEIGTGVDLPVDHQLEYPNVFFHGVSVIRPNQEWSVAHFHNLVKSVLANIKAEHYVVFFVGGTGLYHKHLFNDDPMLFIPPNKELRQIAESMSVEALQQWLNQVNPARLANMNNSDRQNARRLIRAIEVETELATHQNGRQHVSSIRSTVQPVTIGLTDSLEHIRQKIQQRITARIQMGAIEETKTLMAQYSAAEWNMPAFTSTGYQEIKAYLHGTLSETQMQEKWLLRELQYAKRQLTWWKKDDQVHWFDVSSLGWQKNAIDLVQQKIENQVSHEKTF